MSDEIVIRQRATGYGKVPAEAALNAWIEMEKERLDLEFLTGMRFSRRRTTHRIREAAPHEVAAFERGAKGKQGW